MGLNSIEVRWLFATAHKLTNEINIAFSTIHHHHHHHPSGVSACLIVSSKAFWVVFVHY